MSRSIHYEVLIGATLHCLLVYQTIGWVTSILHGLPHVGPATLGRVNPYRSLAFPVRVLSAIVVEILVRAIRIVSH